jgi:hypothetical protein
MWICRKEQWYRFQQLVTRVAKREHVTSLRRGFAALRERSCAAERSEERSRLAAELSAQVTASQRVTERVVLNRLVLTLSRCSVYEPLRKAVHKWHKYAKLATAKAVNGCTAAHMIARCTHRISQHETRYIYFFVSQTLCSKTYCLSIFFYPIHVYLGGC